MSCVPSRLWAMLTTGPGPESGDSRLSESRPHRPEKSGIALCSAQAGMAERLAAAAHNIRESRREPDMGFAQKSGLSAAGAPTHPGRLKVLSLFSEQFSSIIGRFRALA